MTPPARRSGNGKKKPEAKADLTVPIDQVDPDSLSIDKLRRYHAEIGEILARYDADRGPFDRLSRHVRRHLPLYALAGVFALVVVLVPTTNQTGPVSNIASGTSEGTSGFDVETGGGQAAGSAARRARNAAAQAGAAVDSSGAPVGKVEVGTGVTRGGVECKPGVRQLAFSSYANPCVAKFEGNNGGKTARGVDEKTIRIGIRQVAVDAGDVTDQQNRAQGRQDRAGGIALFKKYAGWLNKNMELYGRTVELVDFHSRVSNGIEEAQSRGKDGACADATELASMNVFAVVGYNPSLIESQPFSDCASERGIFLPYGASYFPEKWYTEKWDPFVWHIYMECEQIGRDVAEYMGKRLNGRLAKWARTQERDGHKATDPPYQKQKRIFGTYVPDNDGYQRCVNISETTFKNEYGGKITSRYDYNLDVTQFAQQAEEAVIQFKDDGVTTLINACDTLSTGFLTDAADRQIWGPEWFIIGVALQDRDATPRDWHKDTVDGHLFGLSQLGNTAAIEGKQGEAYQLWKTAFPGTEPPQGFGDAYFRALGVFMMLQASGPTLNAANIANGLRAMPDGGGEFGAFGTWSFKGDHTATDDSREVYYSFAAKGFDGNDGRYLESYGGKRFRSGEWPKEEPPIYKK